MNEETINRLKSHKSQYKVPNLDRGLSILELLSHYPDGLTLTEIGQHLEYPKNSCFRVSMELHVRGFLKRDEQTKKFTLSDKLLELGCSKTGEASLIANAWDSMRKMRDLSGETVLIGTLVENKFVVLDQVLSRHAFKFQIDVGTRCDLHASAPGKAVMAFMAPAELTELLAAIKLKKYTDTTITGRKELRAELEEIRECGYAIDRSEMIEGCHCVAVPILNKHNLPVAAIWTTGPSNRLTADRFKEIGDAMKQLAAGICQN